MSPFPCLVLHGISLWGLLLTFCIFLLFTCSVACTVLSHPNEQAWQPDALIDSVVISPGIVCWTKKGISNKKGWRWGQPHTPCVVSFSQPTCFCQIEWQAESKLQCFQILTVILCLLPCGQFNSKWQAAHRNAQGHCSSGRLCQIKQLDFLKVEIFFSPPRVERDLIST